MSARSLLRQKRQEARITHPLATYTKDGQLRCTACPNAPVKHWEGHLGSKQHRANVARLRAEAEQQEQQRRRAEENERKRSREDADAEAEDDDEEDEEADPEPEAKRTKPSSITPPSGFPADFFSDPSMAPVATAADEDEDVGEPLAFEPPQPPQQKSQLELELEMFQAQVVAPIRSGAIDAADRKLEAYSNATVVAEPIMASETPEGFPPRTGEDNANPQTATATSAPLKEARVAEEEKRREREEMERELIMDRLLAEEQAQEEADNKVLLMKQKLAAAKARRKKA